MVAAEFLLEVISPASLLSGFIAVASQLGIETKKFALVPASNMNSSPISSFPCKSSLLSGHG